VLKVLEFPALYRYARQLALHSANRASWW